MSLVPRVTYKPYRASTKNYKNRRNYIYKNDVRIA